MSSSAAPLIGITTSFQEGEQRLSHAYIQAIEQAGGIPMIIPMLASANAMQQVASRLDGLIISGGPAVMEGLVGDLPDGLSEPAPERVHADRWILGLMWEQRKPILGICYGMQLLNAWTGGTIYGDVELQRQHTHPHSQHRGATTHAISVAPNSTLAQLISSESFSVNTRHFQAVASLGDGFRISAQSPDGVIEAIEHVNGIAWGVQFHPERMGNTMQPLFRHLVLVAKERQHYQFVVDPSL